MGGDAAGPILHSLRPDVPLILSSGYSESFETERVGPGVVAAFLGKPYEPGALVVKVEDVLRTQPKQLADNGRNEKGAARPELRPGSAIPAFPPRHQERRRKLCCEHNCVSWEK